MSAYGAAIRVWHMTFERVAPGRDAPSVRENCGGGRRKLVPTFAGWEVRNRRPMCHRMVTGTTPKVSSRGSSERRQMTANDGSGDASA